MIRYTLSATAATRPTMLSALKTLDPLDDQGEDGEGRNGQHDEDDVAHLGLLVTRIRMVGGEGASRPVGPTLPRHQEWNSLQSPLRPFHTPL